MNIALNLLLNFTIAIGAIFGVFFIGPEIETRWFPVYSKFVVVSVGSDLENGSVVVVEYTRYRNCFAQGYAWYHGDFGTNYRQLDAQRIRSPGSVPSSPERTISRFSVDITPDEFASGVWIEMFSRCHFLWTTRSVVFP